MSRTKQRIYTEKEWKDADSLDRLYIHLMEPERWVLNAYEEDKLDILTGVWKIIVKKASPRERIRIITRTYDCTERSAFRYVQDATKLFMETLDVDHELELRLAYHRFMTLHDKAKSDGDYDSAMRSLERAMKVRLDLEERQPQKKKVYPVIQFVSDPLALVPRNLEDLNFEELEYEENLLESEANRVSEGDKAL